MRNRFIGFRDALSLTSKQGLRHRLATTSWVLYDFSDTIFSASILTFFFPLWITQDMGGSDTIFAFALSLSALVVAITSPMFGTISDRMNRRVPLLAVCVLSCALFTSMIGSVGGLTGGIALFFFANFLYQTGLIFYNSLIANVSSETSRGIISGIGIGAGYIGLFIAFLVLDPYVEENGNQSAFLPTAVMYVLFALPLLLLVSEKGVRRSINMRLLGDSYRQLLSTFQRARKHTNLFRFIAGRFMYMEAINTASSFYVIYLVEAGGFTGEEARDMVVRVLAVAVVAAMVAGVLVARFGAKRVLIVAIVGWLSAVLLVSVVDERWMFWVVAVIAGTFWGAPQVADRVLLTKLAPEGQVGEFFGLFQMSGRLSAVLGPALWGLTTGLLTGLGEVRFRLAMLLIAVFLVIGFVLLLRVRERREESDLASLSEKPTVSDVVD